MEDSSKNQGNGEIYTELVLNDSPGHGKYKARHFAARKGKKIQNSILLLITIMALVCLITGMVLIFLAIKKCKTDDRFRETSSECQNSKEAERVKFEEFLKKVQITYYKLHAENTAWHPEATVDMVRRDYVTYNVAPEAIKRRTDIAFQLLDEFNNKKINVDILKPREYKALLQLKHFLKYIFGTPYDGNYYAGDWMLGPNSFCWQPMCRLGFHIYNNIANLKPRTTSEVGDVIKHFQAINTTILQYISNMKLGIQTGMVRTMKECEGGLFAIKKIYENVSEQGETGALNEWYMRPFKATASFFKNLPAAEHDKWRQQTGKLVNESLTSAIIEHIGRPLAQLLTYLEEEHSLQCRPNNVGAGGLSGLPIDVIYYNGTAKPGMVTKKTLPIADANGKFPTVLNGSKSYELLLGYFTTKDLHPNSVNKLGWTMLNRLFPQVESIARKVTNITNTTEAIKAFKLRLKNRTLNYFNTKEIPENQTKGQATKLCKTIKTAKKYCPDRWAAMLKWFEFARKVMAMLDPKTVSMFYFTGDKHTTPNCPITLMANFNPAHGAQSYQESDTNCTYNAIYNIPFFLKDLGPKFSEYSVNAHEARPGHHTQVQGNIEHFKDKCGGLVNWIGGQQSYYTAFTEGWALYGEYPLIAQETDVYKDEPMQEFGMLKWQIWRALRLIVDTGLHYRGMTRNEAIDLIAKYAWDNTDLADKEVTRYQSNPGQATAYMIGQLDIWAFRNKTQKELGDKFSLKEFHYQTLSQGSSPLSYLKNHIDKYIACKKNPMKEGCELILYPTKGSSTFSINRVYDHELNRIAPRKHHFL